MSNKSVEDQYNLSYGIADCWNTHWGAKRASPQGVYENEEGQASLPPTTSPKLDPLTELPNRGSLNDCFNQMYFLLDDFDSPIKHVSKQGDDEDVRVIRPVEGVHSTGDTHVTVQALTLDENIRVNYQKRALSYFHGAVLAIEYDVRLNDIQKLNAINELTEAYNRYKDGPTRNDFFAVKYDDFWGRNQANFLKRMLVRMSIVLGENGLSYKDISGGETLANLDRRRAHAFLSQQESHSERGVTCTTRLTETPVTAQMNSRHFKDQFSFIESFQHNNVHYRRAPDWFKDLDIAGQNKLLDAYHHKDVKNYPKSKLVHLYIELDLPISQITEPSSLRFLDQLQYLLKVPAWFRQLRPSVQEYLCVQTFDEDRKQSLPSIPATLRKIPLLANMNVHEGQFTTDEKNEAENHSVEHTVYRHGVFTPYGMHNANERREACRANGKAFADLLLPKAEEKFKSFWVNGVMMSGDQMGENSYIPIADISLLSPNDFMDLEVKLQYKRLKKKGLADAPNPYDARLSAAIMEESNRALSDENMDAFTAGLLDHTFGSHFQNLSTNLGINGDRWVLSDTFLNEKYKATVTVAMQKFNEVEDVVRIARNNPLNIQKYPYYPFTEKKHQNKYEMAKNARAQLNEMIQKFGIPLGDSPKDDEDLSKRINAELFANCLYAIMIEGMGGTVSACCKSTKDRTGLFVLHLDAMHQFYAEYGYLPSFVTPENDPMRKRFVDIMANLYLGNMQQYMASQATFGSAGIKKPGGTIGPISLAPIPTDLLNALKLKAPGLFERQKELADINKIGFKISFINFLKSPSHTLENAKIWYIEKLIYYKEIFLEKLNKIWNDIIDHPKTGVESTLVRINPTGLQYDSSSLHEGLQNEGARFSLDDSPLGVAKPADVIEKRPRPLPRGYF